LKRIFSYTVLSYTRTRIKLHSTWRRNERVKNANPIKFIWFSWNSNSFFPCETITPLLQSNGEFVRAIRATRSFQRNKSTTHGLTRCSSVQQSHVPRWNNESGSYDFGSRFDVFGFSTERFTSGNNNGAGSPGIAAAARERLGAALESRGYDVLVINLFCALPATRRAETSFLRRIGLPRAARPEETYRQLSDKLTLPWRKLGRFTWRLSEISLIPLNLETSFRFWRSGREVSCAPSLVPPSERIPYYN